ncbi:13323_t:CDS:2, partial [Entrophospora sp. SA101]
MTIKPHDNNKQLKLQQLLMEWIIFDNQSLNIFKSDSFKTFINSLDPAFSIPDVKFIKQLIHKSYNHTLPLIIKHIEENALSVSLTTDMWTGRNILGFLDVTCSYLDENFKMHEQVLAVDYVRYPHTANHISDTLLAILDEWGVRDLTHIITTDNGSNIKKAIKDMEHSDVDLSETSNYFIQCIGDVPTRWNSSYLAWTRLIKIKEFISLLASSMESESDYDTRKDGKRLKKILLSDEEWELLKELVKILKPFEEATTYLGGSSYITFSMMYPLIQEIKTRLKNNIQSNSISDFETFNLEELDDVFNGEFIEEIEDAEQNDFNLNQPMHTEVYDCCYVRPRTKQLTFIREQNIKDDYKLNLQLKYNQISAQQSTITNISSTN